MAEARQARRRAAAPRPPPPRRQPLVIPAASTLLIAAVLLIAAAGGGGPRGAAAELHDDPSSAQRRYKILALVAIGDTSHSFDLLTVAGRLAKRCAPWGSSLSRARVRGRIGLGAGALPCARESHDSWLLPAVIRTDLRPQSQSLNLSPPPLIPTHPP